MMRGWEPKRSRKRMLRVKLLSRTLLLTCAGPHFRVFRSRDALISAGVPTHRALFRRQISARKRQKCHHWSLRWLCSVDRIVVVNERRDGYASVRTIQGTSIVVVEADAVEARTLRLH